jgi:hypothetical protein
MRSFSVALILVLLWTLTGCSQTPATPDAAVAAAKVFLQARAARDADSVYGLLTGRAREVTKAGAVASYLRGERFSFGQVGAPVEKAPGWVQVPVSDYHVQSAGADTLWPQVLLTLHYEGKHWLVAWLEPALAAARMDYQNNVYGEELELAKAISEIDPYSYYGPLEYHFAYRGLKRLREAEVALSQAAALATPTQAPDVEDAWARFKLDLGHPEDAAPHARAALEKAAPYMPGLYSRHWQADTLVVLGRSLLLTSDRAGATDAANQAAQVDPHNAGVLMLRRDLGL